MNEKKFYEQLGMKIRKEREGKKFDTIGKMCLQLAGYGVDISDSMFGKYELGTKHISVYRLAIVAKELGVAISDLIPEIEEI